MLRAAVGLLRQGGVARSISTSAARLEEAAPAGVKEFIEAFEKIAPSTMNLPEFPSAHVAPQVARDSAADGEQFPVNFYTPDGVVAERKVRARSAAAAAAIHSRIAAQPMSLAGFSQCVRATGHAAGPLQWWLGPPAPGTQKPQLQICEPQHWVVDWVAAGPCSAAVYCEWQRLAKGDAGPVW